MKIFKARVFSEYYEYYGITEEFNIYFILINYGKENFCFS